MRYILGIISILILFSACRLETKRLDHYKVHGIDVSHYQSIIDWDLVAQQDVAFSFIKATEGKTLKDSLFNRNWLGTKRVKIKRGAYHFFRPSVSAHQQARNFIASVKLEPGDLPPVVDIEVMDGTSIVLMVKRLKTWLDIIEYHYHVRPIIYTNLNFYSDHIEDHFKGYPVWIARYNYKAPKLNNGENWHFWQYGNRGQLTGIEGDVDFNVFGGTLKELSEFCLSKTKTESDLVISDFDEIFLSQE